MSALRGSAPPNVTASERANHERWSATDDAWRGYFRAPDGTRAFEDRVHVALSMLEDVRGGALLDIGCATGVITRRVASAVAPSRIVGVDFVDALDDESGGDPPIEFVSSNLDGPEPLPLPDSSFDVVTCFETLEHLHDTDLMVSQIRRVLRPEGRVVLSVPRLDGALGIAMLAAGFQPPAVECSLRRRYGSPEAGARVSGHVSHFTKRALVQLLAAQGLEVLRVGQASIYSAWRHAAPRPVWQRVPLWLMARIPVKQDVLIVSARPCR